MLDDCPVTVIIRETRTQRIERVLEELTQPVPGTKGMGPKDRSDRLHAELERRIALAKDALRIEDCNF